MIIIIINVCSCYISSARQELANYHYCSTEPVLNMDPSATSNLTLTLPTFRWLKWKNADSFFQTSDNEYIVCIKLSYKDVDGLPAVISTGLSNARSSYTGPIILVRI